MTMHVKVAGAWKEVAPGGGLSVKVTGVWKTVAEGHVKVAGVWKQFFVNAVYSLPVETADAGTFGINTIQAIIRMRSNGTWQEDAATLGSQGTGNWVTPTSLAPGAYTVLASWSGTGSFSGTTGLDLALTSDRVWVLEAPSVGNFAGTLTLTLKDGGGNTVATANVSMSVEAL